MWHAIAPVDESHDPVLYENPDPETVLVVNAGPGNIHIQSWQNFNEFESHPDVRLELRPGNIRAVRGCLVRARLIKPSMFSAIGWSILGSGFNNE